MSKNLETETNSNPKAHKFLVLGDTQCGKTSLIDYFCRLEEADQKISNTTGCEVHLKEFINKQDELGVLEHIEFWDFSGDIRHPEILKVYLKALEKDIDCLKGVIFFFDVTNIKTLLHVSKYLNLVVDLLVQKAISSEIPFEDAKIPLMMIGTKHDLLDEHVKPKKNALIQEYIDCIFDNNSELGFLSLSLKSSVAQFDSLTDFIQDCIKENYSKIFLYSSDQELYPHGRFTRYTKKKLSLISKDIKKAKNYISLKMVGLCTSVTAKKFLHQKDTASSFLSKTSFNLYSYMNWNGEKEKLTN